MFHVICDAIVIRPVDVTFELIWRRGATDMPLATWMQHFDPLPNAVYEAQPYELDQPTTAITFKDGDQLVFKFTGANTTSMQAWIPNGDGATANGRIPSFTLPP